MKNYLLFDNVLGKQKSQQAYQLALQKRELFLPSRTSPNRNYPEWRKSCVLYDRDLEPVIKLMEHEVQARLAQVIESLGIPSFQIDSTEIQLTSHNDGEYYHWHTDNGTDETRERILSFVYYFHSQPRQFSGGELVLYHPFSSEEIEPLHDRLILFSSSTKHEVKPVSCISKRFEHGRFTLNGWLRCKSMLQDEYFDAKIFSNPRSIHTETRPTLPSLAITGSSKISQELSGNELASKSALEEGERALALLELYRNLFYKSQASKSIEVRSRITGEEFYEKYYFMNRPVLLEGAMDNSPAVQNWTPQYFETYYGSVPVPVTSGRNLDPNYESNFSETVCTVKLEELIDRLRREPESNDYYLVARNGFFDQPALTHLRKELQPPADIINCDDYGSGTTKLWLGPKDTLTPLHHDLHSILFAQVYGKKHFKLIPPFDTPLLYVQKKFYSAVDPECVDQVSFPEFARATVLDVVVKQGDLLFLPAGWWHWVKALDVSISATFCSFRSRL
jgi:Rps23 Pro-64 3,4-dihydroxylase Tpa1-like proline 4-hydroxylase